MNALTRRQALRSAAVLIASGAPAARAAASLCGSAVAPAYPAVDQPAVVQSWLLDGRQDGPAPDCSGLRTRDFELLVRLTASFASPLDAPGMLTRLGAVSTLKGMAYWSFTDRKWQPLVSESYAIDRPATMATRRADFSAAELRGGTELYFAEIDNRTASLVPYSLQMLSAGPDRLVMRMENVDDLRYLGLKVVGAHEMQWVVALEPLGNGRWGYRSLMGIVSLGFGRAEQHRLSNLSRCVAMFDHLAGRHTAVEGYR
jgi:hypothetical protein